jgi:hypothetical protein
VLFFLEAKMREGGDDETVVAGGGVSSLLLDYLTAYAGAILEEEPQDKRRTGAS